MQKKKAFPSLISKSNYKYSLDRLKWVQIKLSETVSSPILKILKTPILKILKHHANPRLTTLICAHFITSIISDWGEHPASLVGSLSPQGQTHLHPSLGG